MDPQTVSAVRILMMVGGTWLTNHGYDGAKDLTALSDPAVIEAAAGLAFTAGGAVWSLISRTRHGILKSASKVLGDQGLIITDPATAAKLPHNVVGSVTEAPRAPSALA